MKQPESKQMPIAHTPQVIVLCNNKCIQFTFLLANNKHRVKFDREQCDQIGRILKAQGDSLFAYVAQNSDFWCHFKNVT